VAHVWSEHRRDAWGIGFVGLGVVVALGVWFDLAGPFGRAIRTTAATVVGVGRFPLPVVAAAVGAALLWAPRANRPLAPAASVRPTVDPETGEVSTSRPGTPASVRALVGLPVLFVGALGLVHLSRGSPGLKAPYREMRRAGGIVGAFVGEPLESLVGRWGAATVLTTVAIVGLVVVTGVTPYRFLGGTARAGRHAGRVARNGVRALVDLDTAPPPDIDIDLVGDGAADGRRLPPISLYDQGDEERAAAGRRDLEGDDGPDRSGGAVGDEGVDGTDLAARTARRGRRNPSGGDPAAPATAVLDANGQLAMRLDAGAPIGPWQLPTMGMLAAGSARPIDKRVIEAGGRTLEETMLQFGVDARLVGMTVGPTVTRYELELGAGVKVNKVTTLSKDIAYAMATPDVRILAPIPGRSAIGVEVPNRQRQLVSLGAILASPEAAAAVHPLDVGLGRDIAGRPVVVNLATMPHVLIAGQTGAGKSSCINSIITSLLMRATPEQVRLILVDPKRVELSAYNDLPHLLTAVVVDPKKAANALDWAVKEMERRYDVLAECGQRDINGYNAAFDRGELTPSIDPGPDPDDPAGSTSARNDPARFRLLNSDGEPRFERLSYIVIVVDELNDLMMVAARDVEASICRIAQMARAVGIHLVIATQRPSVDVITGVIKANVPSRMAFSVSSIADSRVILDQAGAEKLIGKGDMLVLAASSGLAQRIQGAWIDEADVRKVAAHWRRQTPETRYVEGLADGADGRPGPGGAGGDDEDDDLLSAAMELVVRSQLGSTSMLQRKLRVGFARAGRLMDLLERRGVVGPSEGSKARTVLMTVEELEDLREQGL
jgi:DNA segregation ATPase FtsK/SpoIIIE, S-DNA-T family